MADKKKIFNAKAFHEFEQEHKVFELMDQNGRYIWDIMRYGVYSIIQNNNLSYKSELKATNSESTIQKLLFALGSIISMLRILVPARQSFMIISASRNKEPKSGKSYDQNVDDVLQQVKGSALILETFERDRKRYEYPKAKFINIQLLRKFLSRFHKKQNFDALLNQIEESFGPVEGLNNDVLNRMIADHFVDRIFYNLLLRIQKPKAIFLTQNGIQKGLFAIGRELQIPIVECQHGLVEYAHQAYSYNKDIDYNPLSLYLPKYFFSFSPYWSRSIFYPVREIIPIGNSAFNRSLQTSEVQEAGKGIVVASANIYGQQLKDIVLDLSKLDSGIPVYFKLHPNQWSELSYYQQEFDEYPNIRVITSEEGMGELINRTVGVLVIKSTAVYEALQAQRLGIVYQKEEAVIQDDLDGLPNIHFVQNAQELKAVIDNGEPIEKYSNGYFFSAFDQKRFLSFLEGLKVKKGESAR